VAAAKAAAGSVGATVDVSSDLGYDKTPTVLRQIALTKPQLIIAHASGYDTAAQRIGQQYKIPTVTYDIPSMKSPGAVSTSRRRASRRLTSPASSRLARRRPTRSA